MKILWVSRHKVLSSQKRELRSIYSDDVDIRVYSKVFKDVKEIVNYYKRNKFDDIVIVAPLSVIKKMCELGIKPLWAEMHKGRFIKFKRITDIKIEYEEGK